MIDDPSEGLGGVDEAAEAFVVVSDVAVRDLGDQHGFETRAEVGLWKELVASGLDLVNEDRRAIWKERIDEAVELLQQDFNPNDGVVAPSRPPCRPSPIRLFPEANRPATWKMRYGRR